MAPADPAVRPADDTELIAAWLGGAESAAAELVRRHTRALARFLVGAGAPEADLDDLVQESFIRAFRALGSFRNQCQFRTWLLTIGGNALKDLGRRVARPGRRRSGCAAVWNGCRACSGKCFYCAPSRDSSMTTLPPRWARRREPPVCTTTMP